MSVSAGTSSSDMEKIDVASAPVTIFKKLHPVEYLERHLKERIREDGRTLDQLRSVSVATGTLSQPFGSALVRLGEGTLVTASVTARIAHPTLERPNEGFLIPSVDLSSLCSPLYNAGPPEEEGQVLTHDLQMFLNNSGILPRSALCIEKGLAVWAIYVDVVCVSAEGSVLDAAALATVAALHDCQLPRIDRFVNSSQAIFDPDTKERLPLMNLPIFMTLGMYESTYVLADLTAFEESLCTGSIQVGLVDVNNEVNDPGNAKYDVFWLKVLGPCTTKHPQPLENEALIEWCIEKAQKRAQKLCKLIKDALQKRA